MSTQTQLVRQLEKNDKVAIEIEGEEMKEEFVDAYPPTKTHIREKTGALCILHEYGNHIAVMFNDVFRRR